MKLFKVLVSERKNQIVSSQDSQDLLLLQYNSATLVEKNRFEVFQIDFCSRNKDLEQLGYINVI